MALVLAAQAWESKFWFQAPTQTTRHSNTLVIPVLGGRYKMFPRACWPGWLSSQWALGSLRSCLSKINIVSNWGTQLLSPWPPPSCTHMNPCTHTQHTQIKMEPLCYPAIPLLGDSWRNLSTIQPCLHTRVFIQLRRKVKIRVNSRSYPTDEWI